MELPGGQKRLVLAACVLGSAVVFLDQTVVNVALPAIREELGGGLAGQQWIVDSYLVTLASLLLLGGALGDRYGRRRVFALSLAGFAATSLLCALAPTDELLIAARALQGADGALLVPGSLAIISTVFTGRERGRAIGLWTAWTGIAFVIGPLVGGLLVDAASWRLVFAINLPLVALALAILARTCPESRGTDGHGLDLPGAALGATGLAATAFALIEQPRLGFGDPLVLLPLTVGLALLGAFLWHERRTAEPMLPPEIFRVRNFAAANAASVALYGGLAASSFLLVLFLQQVAGYSALEAGLALLPTTLVMFALSARFGDLAGRTGPRFLMAAGPAVGAVGLALAASFSAEPDYLAEVLPAVTIFGLGLAMTVAPLTATVLGAVPEERVGLASGINNAATRVAALLAIAAVGAAVAAQFGAALESRLPPDSLSRTAAREADAAKRTPLAPRAPEGLPPAERARITESSTVASVSAYRLGMLLSAALVLLGGLISAVGITNRPDRGGGSA